ncbi:MAG: ThiF family adenylyltransferase [Acidobacteriota bacterium]
MNQILFRGIGEEGQDKIAEGRVCIVGCGALGTMVAIGLARAGAGHIRIIDRDFVELKNLHRQVLFDEEDVRKIMPKAAAAEKKLRKANSSIHVEGIVSDLNHLNAEELLKNILVIVDGTDNFETRFLINEFSIKHSIPWIYGAAVGSYGLTLDVLPGESPCLKCIFETSPPPGLLATCDTAGIVPSVTSVIGSIQCVETLKILSGNGAKLNRFITAIDVWEGTFQRIKLVKERHDCPVCDAKVFPLLAGEGISLGVNLCGRNSVQIRSGMHSTTIDLLSLKEKIQRITSVYYNGFLLRMSLEGFEVTVFPDGRAIIGGTDDPVRARSIYSKYIGN